MQNKHRSLICVKRCRCPQSNAAKCDHGLLAMTPPPLIEDAGSVSSQIRYPSPARPAPQTAPDHGFSQESPRKQRVCCERVRCEERWQKRASTVDPPPRSPLCAAPSPPTKAAARGGGEPGAGVGQSRAAPYDARVITYMHGPFAAPAARRTREVRGDAARQVATQTASHASAPEPSKPTANPNPNETRILIRGFTRPHTSWRAQRVQGHNGAWLGAKPPAPSKAKSPRTSCRGGRSGG